MASKPVYTCGEFDVFVETMRDDKFASGLRETYVIRYRPHGVVHQVTPIYGEAVMMAEAFEAATLALLNDPKQPVQLPSLGGPSGLN